MEWVHWKSARQQKACMSTLQSVRSRGTMQEEGDKSPQRRSPRDPEAQTPARYPVYRSGDTRCSSRGSSSRKDRPTRRSKDSKDRNSNTPTNRDKQRGWKGSSKSPIKSQDGDTEKEMHVTGSTKTPTKIPFRPASDHELKKFLPQFMEFDQFQANIILIRGENPKRTKYNRKEVIARVSFLPPGSYTTHSCQSRARASRPR